MVHKQDYDVVIKIFGFPYLSVLYLSNNKHANNVSQYFRKW
jgi:hypothetical protein